MRRPRMTMRACLTIVVFSFLADAVKESLRNGITNEHDGPDVAGAAGARQRWCG
jgi:hypothetical protein